MKNTVKYIAIILLALVSGYFLICGVALLFLYQDRSGAISYLWKACMVIIVYFLVYYMEELLGWWKKHGNRKQEDERTIADVEQIDER